MFGRYVLPPAFFGPVLHLDLLLVFGERPPRVDLVDADALARQIRRQVTGHRHQPAFRDRINEQIPLPAQRIDRSHIQNMAPVSLLPELRNGSLCQEKGRTQVHGDQPVKVFDGRIIEIGARDKSRIVDERIKAPEPLDGDLDKMRRHGRILQVSKGKRSGLPQFFHKRSGAPGAPAMNHRPAALGHDAAGCELPDARGRAGNEDDLVPDELSHVSIRFDAPVTYAIRESGSPLRTSVRACARRHLPIPSWGQYDLQEAPYPGGRLQADAARAPRFPNSAKNCPVT